MRVFVTGASGWIGSALVSELLAHGHEVLGLARSDASARLVEAAGAEVWRGDLDDPAGLARAAGSCDGVAHLAFQHDVAFGRGDFAAATTADRRAVEAMGAALAGSEKPFVLASGMVGLTLGRPAVEADGLMPPAALRGVPALRRQATALYTLSLWGEGVRSSVLRFPPTVHGAGDAGFIATVAAAARRSGSAGYVGEGANRWPAVHRSDAAVLTRLALESAPGGTVLHAVGEEGVAFADIAAAMGEQMGLPTASLTAEEAATHFAPIGHFVGVDCPATAAFTRELLGWEPEGPSLIEDILAGHYPGTGATVGQ